MRELGAELVAIDRGARAIDEATTSRFDVALVDLHMPEMDGVEVTLSSLVGLLQVEAARSERQLQT